MKLILLLVGMTVGVAAQTQPGTGVIKGVDPVTGDSTIIGRSSGLTAFYDSGTYFTLVFGAGPNAGELKFGAISTVLIRVPYREPITPCRDFSAPLFCWAHQMDWGTLLQKKTKWEFWIDGKDPIELTGEELRKAVESTKGAK